MVVVPRMLVPSLKPSMEMLTLETVVPLKPLRPGISMVFRKVTG